MIWRLWVNWTVNKIHSGYEYLTRSPTFYANSGRWFTEGHKISTIWRPKKGLSDITSVLGTVWLLLCMPILEHLLWTWQINKIFLKADIFFSAFQLSHMEMSWLKGHLSSTNRLSYCFCIVHTCFFHPHMPLLVDVGMFQLQAPGVIALPRPTPASCSSDQCWSKQDHRGYGWAQTWYFRYFLLILMWACVFALGNGSSECNKTMYE